MKEFEIKEYCDMCNKYEDLDRKDLEEKIDNIIKELEEEEEKGVFKGHDNLTCILIKIPMRISREELKGKILDLLYGKEDK